ncbi:aRABinose 5-phosphate isomerase, partial [Paramuricea clavata]
PNKTHEKSIVGGVTLNHLSWASILGVPTGLLALQGDDKSGKLIRKTMKNMNVSTEFVQVSKKFTTGESFVFVQEDGERSIVMATGATSLMNEKIARHYFEKTIMNDCQMLTTEISQVPLSGVLAVLQTAKAAGITTVLDLDVSPSVAINEAQLGTIDELIECVRTADILKPAKHAAKEMLPYLASEIMVDNMVELTKVMREACGSKLIAITCGEDSSILATENHLVEVPAVRVSRVVDATGAGDAFLGGLVSGLYYNGLPSDETNLRKLGQLGNIVGGACCEVLGALPTEESRIKLDKELEELLGAKIAISRTENNDDTAERLQGFKESVKLDVECATTISGSLETAAVESFIDILENCSGRVLVSGIGKSGILAQRMSASLASTGTPSHFIHGAEWTHGDLGKYMSLTFCREVEARSNMAAAKFRAPSNYDLKMLFIV